MTADEFPEVTLPKGERVLLFKNAIEIDGVEHPLPPSFAKFLYVAGKHFNKTISFDRLIAAMERRSETGSLQSVAVSICNLRKKLKQIAPHMQIKNVHSLGYVLCYCDVA